MILQVGELDTEKAVWDAIHARYVGAERVKEAKLQTLMAEFDRLKMKDGDTIDTFAGKLSEIASKSVSLGEMIEKPKLVKKILKESTKKEIYSHGCCLLNRCLTIRQQALRILSED